MFQRLLAHEQQWRRLLGASAAVSTAAVTFAANRPKETLQSNGDDAPADSWLSLPRIQLPPLTGTTQCQMHMLAPSFQTGDLRRHRTIELLESTSEADTTVDDTYNVKWEKPLGVGSFGSVYSAKHRKSGQRVAIKKIPKRFTSSKTFQREMEALASIRQAGGHIHICSLRENFTDEGHFYLVLDLVEGGEMFEALCMQEGAYSEADAARLIRQVASALSFLHSIGIVHSDLKPENLMLSDKKTDNSSIKLVDFGCAHSFSEKAENHRHRGTAATPAYCPPEVLKVCRKEHAKIEPSFDMWSLGVIVYIMLTGAHPFDLSSRNTDEQIEELVLSGKKPPLHNSSVTAHLSKDAIDLMDRFMCWDPAKRMTADELLQNPWIQGKTASTKKIPRSEARLAAYRKHKTGVGTHFFRHMLMASTSELEGEYSDAAKRSSLLEIAFRQIDTKGRGYVSTKELHGDTSYFGEDAKLTLAEVSDLLSQDSMTNEYFPKGHLVYTEGDPGEYMYFINSGSVNVTSKEGFRKSRGAGEFFGQDALRRDDKKYINTIVCETPVHAIRISREYFDKYVKADEESALTMEETDRVRNRERANTILGLHKKMKRQEFEKGDVIFRKGDQGNTLYLLEEGTVDISVDGHKVRRLRLGEMTGEHAAFFGHKPYNVTARCVTDKCKMGALSSREMHSVFKSNPSLKASFHDIILRRDFKKALCAATERPFPETEAQLRAAFDIIDDNKSGDLDFEKLYRIMKKFDPLYAEEDIQQMLKSMDLTNSNSLTWNEFKRIFGMSKV